MYLEAMKLLYFAHPGEAKEFLNFFEFKGEKFDRLYKNENTLLLIGGEGLDNPLLKIGHIIALYDITEIINLGIAGSLSDELEVHKVYEIRTCYGFGENSPKFNSYETQNEIKKYDCISTEKRTVDEESAHKLSHFAHIVDRELWAIAKVASFYKIPLFAYKLISDKAGINTHCLDIKNNSDYFSKLLLDFYQDIHFQHSGLKESKYIYPFRMGHYLQKSYEKTVDKYLKLNPNETQSSLLKKVPLNEIQDQKIKDKEKAALLIKKIQSLTYPIEEKINQKLKHLFDIFDKNEIKYQIDPNLEKQSFKISKEINHEKNITDLIRALEGFKFKDLESFWQGDLDV